MSPLRNQELTNKEIERWYRLRNMRNAAQAFVVIAIIVLVAGYVLARLVRPGPAVKDPDQKTVNTVYKHSIRFRGLIRSTSRLKRR